MKVRLQYGLVAVAVISSTLPGQDRLASMPGYAQFSRMAPVIGQVSQQVNGRRVSNINWLRDGLAVEYTVGGQAGKRYRYTFATKTSTEIPFASPPAQRPPAGVPVASDCGQAIDRGRQVEAELSPDKARLAVYRDRNLYLTTPGDCQAA
jgi:dipeptidyl-peptidase 4